MTAPQALGDLSEPMQAGLRRAHSLGVPVDDPESVGVKAVTIAALERHGLIAQRTTRKSRRTEWRPTDRGRHILVTAEPRFLGRGLGYTPTPSRALAVRGPDGTIEREEGLDETTLAGLARGAQDREEERYEQRLAELQRLPLEQRVALAMRVADRRRIDIQRDLRVVTQRLEKIEATLWRPVDRTADAERGETAPL